MQILAISIEHLEKTYNTTNTPILAYCRKLAENGIDVNTQLQVTRKGRPAVFINDIYAAAKLTVKEEPTVHFAKYSPPSAKIMAAKHTGVSL